MTEALRAALASAASGDQPDGIALMRIMAEADSAAAARASLARAIAEASPAGAATLARLARLWKDNPQAWGVVRGTLALAPHDAAAPDPATSLRAWAAAFDRLATEAPEAGMALYTLGNPDLLATATREVVDYMDGLGLLDRSRHGLDLGCGIGRFLVALAPRLATLVGVDLSAGMVTEARRRCAHLANVRVEVGNGHDLDRLPDRSLDIILAADVFPYLVQAGGDVADRHVDAFARLLRPGGHALVLNIAYGEEPGAAMGRVTAWADRAGLRVARTDARPFATWDACAVLLHQPG